MSVLVCPVCGEKLNGDKLDAVDEMDLTVEFVVLEYRKNNYDYKGEF